MGAANHLHHPPAGSPIPPDLLSGFARREVVRGCLLATPASARDQVFVVESGRLRVYLAGENRELSLSFLGPGDIYTTHTPTYVYQPDPRTVRGLRRRGSAGAAVAGRGGALLRLGGAEYLIRPVSRSRVRRL